MSKLCNTNVYWMLRILATYSITQNIVWPGKQRAGGGGRKPLCSLEAGVFLGIQTSHFMHSLIRMQSWSWCMNIRRRWAHDVDVTSKSEIKSKSRSRARTKHLSGSLANVKTIYFVRWLAYTGLHWPTLLCLFVLISLNPVHTGGTVGGWSSVKQKVHSWKSFQIIVCYVLLCAGADMLSALCLSKAAVRTDSYQLHVHIGQKGWNNYNPKSHKSYVVVPGLSYAR